MFSLFTNFPFVMVNESNSSLVYGRLCARQSKLFSKCFQWVQYISLIDIKQFTCFLLHRTIKQKFLCDCDTHSTIVSFNSKDTNKFKKFFVQFLHCNCVQKHKFYNNYVNWRRYCVTRGTFIARYASSSMCAILLWLDRKKK